MAPRPESDAVGDAAAVGAAVGRLAAQALTREVELTPKPGLVDRANSGAHDDMDIGTFRASIAALSPWFARFFRRGADERAAASTDLLSRLRTDGMACERDMLAATGGVNTHKGSVFAFGLLCAAAGRRHARGDSVDVEGVCAEVAAMCEGIVERELAAPSSSSSPSTSPRSQRPMTAGERLHARHGLTGARGEAQSGFATARLHGLAPYRAARARGDGDEAALHEALLHLIAHNRDTNLVSRGGLDGLAHAQARAASLLAEQPRDAATRRAQLEAFDRDLTRRRLSPGGSADLLAVTWFLAHLHLLPWPVVAAPARAANAAALGDTAAADEHASRRPAAGRDRRAAAANGRPL